MRFVHEGAAAASPWDDVQHQTFLGDERFAERFRGSAKQTKLLREVAKVQRRGLGMSLAEYRRSYPSRDEAMARAYLAGNFSMKEIGECFGVHYMIVSRAVRKTEAAESVSASKKTTTASARARGKIGRQMQECEI